MSEHLHKHAGVVRLARMLRCEPDDLAFLEDAEGVEPATIERLSEQVTSVLFDTHSDRLRGVRAAANLLPTPLAASIGERAMGPVLCALLVGAVDDGRLVAISRRLSAPFLAEVALHIDPRRVPKVVVGLPPATITAVAAELVEQREFATLGQFIGFVTDDGLDAAVAELDGDALLHTAALVPGGARIDRIVAELSDGRLEAILVAAQHDGAWLELLGLSEELLPGQRRRAADLAVEHHPSILDELATFVEAEGHWSPMLTLLGSISPSQRPGLAALDTFDSGDAMAGLVAATATEGRWADLLAVAVHLSPEARRRLAEELGGLDPTDLHQAIVDLSGAGLDDELVTLLTLLPDEDHDHMLGTTLRRTAAERSWADLLALFAILPEAAQDRLAAQAEALTDGDLAAFVRTVDGTELWEPALHLLSRLAATTQDRLLGPMGRMSKSDRQAVADQIDVLGVRERLGALAELFARPAD